MSRFQFKKVCGWKFGKKWEDVPVKKLIRLAKKYARRGLTPQQTIQIMQ